MVASLGPDRRRGLFPNHFVCPHIPTAKRTTANACFGSAIIGPRMKR
jgi:hypothetical protein